MKWEQIEAAAKEHEVPTIWMFRELWQRMVLATIMSMDTTHRIVFQGGTALRLCYGNTRFSEDLDFVMNKKSLPYSLSEPILPFHQIVEHLRPMLPGSFEITWKIQKATPTLQRTVLTTPLPDKTNVRLHLEFVTVPSYDPRTLTLHPSLFQ